MTIELTITSFSQSLGFDANLSGLMSGFLNTWLVHAVESSSPSSQTLIDIKVLCCLVHSLYERHIIMYDAETDRFQGSLLTELDVDRCSFR